MAIDVTCSCGKRLRAKAELAGKRVKCPVCHQPLTVPAQLEEVQPLGDLLGELGPSDFGMAAMAVQPDPLPQRGNQSGPRYEIIGKTLACPWKPPARGSIVVSREAFYLVAEEDPEEVARAVATLAGGPLAVLLGDLFRSMFGGKQSRRKPPLDGLPDAILRDPEWPVRRHTGPVIVLTREKVRRLRFNWKAYLHIVTDSGKYKVPVGTFKIKKVRQVLTQMGWQM